ncbi:MAG: response regulator, partial [Desulfobacterales bacterium]|nr:response regulator [Desulfobacterales bacterium]
PEDHEKAKWVFNERRTGERASSGVELHFLFSPESDVGRQREADFLTVELESTGIYQEGGFGQEKAYVGTYGVARDISYRKLLETELRQAQKMKAVGTLAGGIAHDFNNLLMVIQGYTSLMMGTVDLNHPNYKKLKSIEHHVQSGAELTRQLLGFARTGKYNVQPVNINSLIHKTASMFGRTRKEIRLHTQFHKDLWAAEVDEGQIEQVLLNLYLNACQAMPGGGDIFIETENVPISADKGRQLGLNPGNYIRIGVRDTGIGMEPEILQRIFEPFFTTKERFCGTGLGLASAYGIIDNHGGAIKVSSRRGAGSTFQLYLPASQKKATDRTAGSEKVVSGQGTVLLVDDEVTIIEVTREMLQKLGYRVISAGGGKEAVALFEANRGRIDLVILDMIMPEMGGGETFDQIKRIKPEVNVLLSSGYSMKGEAEKILRRGCNGFIQKPYRLEQLSEKISEIFKRKKVSQASPTLGPPAAAPPKANRS